MKLRAIRRKVATIVGIVMAVSAMIWLLIIDTYGKSSVTWLFAAMLMLIGGAGSMLASYFLQNPESKGWLIFDIINPFFQIGFFITQVVFVSKGKGSMLVTKLGEFGKTILPILMLIIGAVGMIVVIAAVVIDIILYVKLDKENSI